MGVGIHWGPSPGTDQGVRIPRGAMELSGCGPTELPHGLHTREPRRGLDVALRAGGCRGAGQPGTTFGGRWRTSGL